MTLDKAALRQRTIENLKKITEKERHDIEASLHENLINSSLWKEADVIGITISNGFEWDTIDIIKTAWKQRKQIYVPKCFPENREMTFYKIENFNQTEVVYYNLLEPKPHETESIDKNLIDLIVVPGVVFDNLGYRIGFGGGYYDRFLSDFKNKTVSLLHSTQLIDRVPKDSHDIAVSHLITEEGYIG